MSCEVNVECLFEEKIFPFPFWPLTICLRISQGNFQAISYLRREEDINKCETWKCEAENLSSLLSH